MARRNLTNDEVEAMARELLGSAAEYLRLRREELAKEEAERRRKTRENEWVETFRQTAPAATREQALQALHEKELREATEAAERADQEARVYSRVSGVL